MKWEKTITGFPSFCFFLTMRERALVIACLLSFSMRAMPEGGIPILLSQQICCSVSDKLGHSAKSL